MRKTHKIRALTGILASLCIQSTVGKTVQDFDPEIAARWVMIGGHDDLDPCLATGIIISASGERVLVREAPHKFGEVVDRAKPGQVVWLCDASPDKQWTGIVYRSTSDDSNPWDGYGDLAEGQINPLDCELGGSEPERHPYPGPCQTGWVKNEQVGLLAG